MEHLSTFKERLNAYDKDACVSLVHRWIDTGELDLLDVYQDILARALSDVTDKEIDPCHKIWDEHMKSQILRTVLESLYPKVIASSPALLHRDVAILCPEGEYHEIGARIVADYFRMLGYTPWFFGNSLPNEEVVDLISTVDFSFLAFSVNNFYSLSALNALLKKINEIRPKLTLILGGQAIHQNIQAIDAKNIAVCQTYGELAALLKGDQT
jgi:methanogenic corrinoid protein MtbC1